MKKMFLLCTIFIFSIQMCFAEEIDYTINMNKNATTNTYSGNTTIQIPNGVQLKVRF